MLEAPLWLLSFAYIMVTVTVGYTFPAIAPRSPPLAAWTSPGRRAAPAAETEARRTRRSAAAGGTRIAVRCRRRRRFTTFYRGATVLLRLVQRRPWLHRVAGRALLIGDVPWVSQSLEAFVSKCFALSYSVASVAVSSGNPCDHLVHRHTHRVVRGTLLAVGRPDGRLNALASAENTICLAVNQASSIQSLGVTCESLTLGHNPACLADRRRLPADDAAALYIEVEPEARRGVVEHAAEAAVFDGQVALGGVDEEAPASLKRGLTGTVADFGFAPPQATPPAKGGARCGCSAPTSAGHEREGDAPVRVSGSPGVGRIGDPLREPLGGGPRRDGRHVEGGSARAGSPPCRDEGAGGGEARRGTAGRALLDRADRQPFIGAWMYSTSTFCSSAS